MTVWVELLVALALAALIEWRSRRILNQLAALESARRREAMTVAEALADLGTKVAENTAVDESAMILITGIKAQLDELLALGDPQEIVAGLSALSAQLATDNAALAAKVAESTPADPNA